MALLNDENNDTLETGENIHTWLRASRFFVYISALKTIYIVHKSFFVGTIMSLCL